MRSRGNYSQPERHRCAIYTRKSSEEGLEQDFNSLDAQREACEAYIKSQKSAGWIALPAMYDDGGFSGGSMERPALRRLLADIEAGQIDTVIVYKVDRLTRSLADFAKIVDAFDAKKVSFVSVTQQFNTTTSMGRLTLNMLLSFAQFEREVTGERIRDKIAASKAKGMWMGGATPLGYDATDRKLLINIKEADTVRHIFRRYAALKSVRALKDDLDAAGIVSKVRICRDGARRGGVPMVRGALYLMLQNQIYRGKIVHKGTVHPGQHDAIIDEELWNEVQDALTTNRVERTVQSTATAPSLLASLVYDSSSERMVPTHANKKGVRYRYYVSQSLIKRGRAAVSETACRVPAADLETLVENRICALLRDQSIIVAASDASSISVRKALIERSADLARHWNTLPATRKRVLLHVLINRIDVRSDRVEIAICPAMITHITKPDPDLQRLPARPTGSIEVLTIPARVRRTGMETRLLIESAQSDDRQPDRSLLRLLGQARRFHDMVAQNTNMSVAELAAAAGVTRSYFTRVFRLNFLAPRITMAILQGRQPLELTANKLKQAGALSPFWPDQLRQLGFN
ncbi:recombinase family protein [Hyphomicrobium sp.]|jgi:DNA invertase Pin-like site-specific DNA recombinase|uniref:recombinase family protein n=1 Tax=Hyphomicrobium sp. TaxID=82 RepID=UPI002C40512C|nr:recombinase family protein [Hyphomicrobium sp.]HVZ03581.1 recombinase family protein [Hyphomicrobium sp.]